MPQEPSIEVILIRHIETAIKETVDAAREQLVKEAVAEFEKQVREIVGKTAINVSNMYSLQRHGNELVIHVKLEP